jgi:hypothetical protein
MAREALAKNKVAGGHLFRVNVDHLFFPPSPFSSFFVGIPRGEMDVLISSSHFSLILGRQRRQRRRSLHRRLSSESCDKGGGGGRSQNSDSISASDGGKKEEKTPPSFFPLFFFTILSRAIVPFCRSEKGGL